MEHHRTKAIVGEPAYHCPHLPGVEDHEPVCCIVKLGGGRNYIELGLQCRTCGALLDKKRLPDTIKCFG